MDARYEEHVQQAVEHAHVEADEEDDEFAEEQLERPHQEDPHPLAERPFVEVLLRHVVGLARLRAHSLCPPRKDRRRVCLGYREGDEHPDEASEDELDPIQPTPTHAIEEESSNKGPNLTKKSDAVSGWENFTI